MTMMIGLLMALLSRQIYRCASFSLRPVSRGVAGRTTSATPRSHVTLMSRFQSSRCHTGNDRPIFAPGDKIQVEIISFGPLGASVDVVAPSHEEKDVIPADVEALAAGLILQREIQYFRQSRGNIDVLRGEILSAYVERVRDDGKIDVSLRSVGLRAKADDVSQQILDKLRENGSLPVGDRSDPQEIQKMFPGVSKKSFKLAISDLYKKRLVKLDKHSVALVVDNDSE